MTDEEILHKQIDVCKVAKKKAETELDNYGGSNAEINKVNSMFLHEMKRYYNIRVLKNTIIQNKLLIEHGEFQIRKIEQTQKEFEQEMFDFVQVQIDLGIEQPLYHTHDLSEESLAESKMLLSRHVKAVEKKRKELRILAAQTRQMILQFKEEKIVVHKITQMATSILLNIQAAQDEILMHRQFPKIKSERLEIFSDLMKNFHIVYSDILSITTILCADPKFVNMTTQNRQIKMGKKMGLVDELGIIVDKMIEQDKSFNLEEYNA